MTPPPKRYGWYARRHDPAKASIRLRLLGPIAALRARGIDIEPFQAARADRYDAILFSKSFTAAALDVARRARANGTKVIVDICDNMFDQAARAGKSAKLDRIVVQLDQADLVTVATATLGEQLVRRLPALADRLRIVPDMLEDLAAAPPRRLADRWHMAGLDAFLGRHAGAVHCVWFGKSSGAASGFVHLARAVRELEAFAPSHAVTLTVIGDDRAAFRAAARGWAVPSHYLPWSLGTFAAALRLHRVAVIPVEDNAYTAGKTINRPATAILAGLGVIADAIGSYQELRGFVSLDDWRDGLTRYAFGWDGERARIAAAQAHLLHHYGPDAVADRWEAVLRAVAAPELT